MTLSAKQQAFVNAYLETFNATEAARQAKYNGNDATLANIGWENVRKREIAEAISQRLSESAMTADEVLTRLADQARGTIEDFVDIDSNISNAVFLNFEKARANGKLALIKKLKYNAQGYPEIELHDAQAALVQIGKHHKLFADKIDVEHMGETVLRVIYGDDGTGDSAA